MSKSLKDHFLSLGITSKLSLLTTLIILATLLITFTISVTREIQFKNDEARKLMINLGKQIGLMKELSEPLSQNALSEYLETTVRSSLSRIGDSIQIVYIITTNAEGELEQSVFNWNIIKTSNEDAAALAQNILSRLTNNKRTKTPSISKNIQNVKLDMGPKGTLYIGFSMKILKNEILTGFVENLLIALILIAIGILAARSFSRKITEPLFTLIEGFQKVSKGDFHATVQIHTRDELETLAGSFNQMTAGLRERELIKDSFRRYATDQVVEKILQSENRPTLSGELRDITVLFSDIRMFTSLSTKLRPEQVVYILNRYFTAMTDIAIENEGFIDKFTGDEMMVVFGAPIHHEDDPQRALRTAIKMLRALKNVNHQFENEGYPKIDIGIGINTGVAIAGNIGSEKRMDYTVIGQDVNLAARLVAIAQKGEICVSEQTFEKVKGLVQGTEDMVTLKGLENPLKIYRIKPE